jgi:hypothetical protein
MASPFMKALPAALQDAIKYARRRRSEFIQPVGNAIVPQYHALFDHVYAAHATEQFAGKNVTQITTNDWRVLFYYKLTTRHHFDEQAVLNKIHAARDYAAKTGNPIEDGWAVSQHQRQADRQRALDNMCEDMRTWSDAQLQSFAGLSEETAWFVRWIAPANRKAIVDDWHTREPEFLSAEAPFARPYDLVIRSRRSPLVFEQERSRFDKRAMHTPRLAGKNLTSELSKLPPATLTTLFKHYGADTFDRRNGRAAGKNRSKLLAACIIAADGAQFGASYTCSPKEVQRARKYL